jgi:hypothetical protein
VVPMSKEKKYVTVRIPESFDDLINKYLEAHKEEMMFLNERTSRAGVVKKALYELFKKEGITQEKSPKIQGDVSKPDDFSVYIKETFFAHSIIKMAKEATLPPSHLDMTEIEQRIRLYITKRAEEKGIKITKEYLDELSEDILKKHKEIIEGLTLAARIEEDL